MLESPVPRRATDNATIRDWARARGIEVNPRGSVRGDVREQYMAAHDDPPASDDRVDDAPGAARMKPAPSDRDLAQEVTLAEPLRMDLERERQLREQAQAEAEYLRAELAETRANLVHTNDALADATRLADLLAARDQAPVGTVEPSSADGARTVYAAFAGVVDVLPYELPLPLRLGIGRLMVGVELGSVRDDGCRSISVIVQEEP